MPEFEVIISLHKSDTPSWFSEAWRSIINQSVSPTGIYVTVDGPLTDDLESELALLIANPQRVPVIEVRHEPVNSRGILLGKAIVACKAQLIAIMDADDVAYRNRFEQQLMLFAKDPTLDVVGSAIEEICPQQMGLEFIKHVPQTHERILKYAKYRNPINNMSVMLRRSAVLDAGNYQHMPDFADYWLWVRMLQNGSKFLNINAPLVRARAGSSMLDRRRGLKYAKNEVHFLKNCYRIGFLSFVQSTTLTFIRTPVRFAPKFVLQVVYRFLRRPKQKV